MPRELPEDNDITILSFSKEERFLDTESVALEKIRCAYSQTKRLLNIESIRRNLGVSPG